MFEGKEFLTIQEASIFAGKPEITIRRLIKRLSHDYQNDNQGLSELVISDYQTGRLIYKINRQILIERFNLKAFQVDSQPNSQEVSDEYQQDNKKQEDDYQVSITADYIETLKIQLRNKDEEIQKLHKLLENQQILNVETIKRLPQAKEKSRGLLRWFGS
jgi:Protein of unknown function, DUF536